MSKLKTDPAGYAIDRLKERSAALTPTSRPCAAATSMGGLSFCLACTISVNYIPIGAAIWSVFAAVGACVSSAFETERVKISSLIEILETLRGNQSSSVSETLRLLEDFQKGTATCGTHSVNLKDILFSIRMANKLPIENLGEPLATEDSDVLIAENPMYRSSSRLSIWTSQPGASAPLAEVVYSPIVK